MKFTIGQIVSNQEICSELKCSTQGGMRRSHTTNTLTLISDHTLPLEKNPYQDKWINEILEYTGMGLNGNQSIDFAQNKTLAQSSKLDISIHLFEVYQKGEYTYKGIVYLYDKPYQKKQIDNEGNERLVWIFPLKLKI